MKRNSKLLSILVFICITVASCSKDNEQEITDNPGGGTCDTVNVKYATGVVPILQANCYSCHGNGASEGGVSLDNYNAVRTRADNESLLGSITHASGHSPMPKNGAKLSDCNINKIRSWVNNGALNN
jgi:hypothetical protein